MTHRERAPAAELARIARFLTETLDMAVVGRRVVGSVCARFEVPAAVRCRLALSGEILAEARPA